MDTNLTRWLPAVDRLDPSCHYLTNDLGEEARRHDPVEVAAVRQVPHVMAHPVEAVALVDDDRALARAGQAHGLADFGRDGDRVRRVDLALGRHGHDDVAVFVGRDDDDGALLHALVPPCGVFAGEKVDVVDDRAAARLGATGLASRSGLRRFRLRWGGWLQYAPRRHRSCSRR